MLCLFRLDLASGWQLFRLLLPEVLVCACAIYIYSECVQPLPRLATNSDSALALDATPISQNRTVPKSSFPADTENSEGTKWKEWLLRKRLESYMEKGNDFAFSLLLGMAGMIHPSFISLPYFACFLFLATYWATNHLLSRERWKLLRTLFAPYCAVHLALLYMYQSEYMQETVPADSFKARYG